MNNETERESVLRRIRKLLAIAEDGRGDLNEAGVAAQHAANLMRKYNVETAEIQLKELDDSTSIDRVHTRSGPTDRKRKKYREIPLWVGFIGIGVAKLFNCIVDGTKIGDEVVTRFTGYNTDTQVASWLFTYLVDAVYRASKSQLTPSSKDAFRKAAASALQIRLKQMAVPPKPEETSSTALMVIDKKLQKIREIFGPQRITQTRNVNKGGVGGALGAEFGRNLNIPAGRPVEQTPIAGKLSGGK